MSATPQFQHGIIPPDAIAYKLAAWKNFKTPKFAEQAKSFPRLPEVAWAIQWFSMQPGGLAQLVEYILTTFPDRVGTL